MEIQVTNLTMVSHLRTGKGELEKARKQHRERVRSLEAARAQVLRGVSGVAAN